MLTYDLLDVPFPLIRRIAAWQRDNDDTLMPPGMGNDGWWECHTAEEIEISKALQAALGAGVVVKLYRREGWLTLDQVARADAGIP